MQLMLVAMQLTYACMCMSLRMHVGVRCNCSDTLCQRVYCPGQGLILRRLGPLSNLLIAVVQSQLWAVSGYSGYQYNYYTPQCRLCCWLLLLVFPAKVFVLPAPAFLWRKATMFDQSIMMSK